MIQTILPLVLAALVFVAFIIYMTFSAREKLRQRLDAQFGKKPTHEIELKSISGYWQEKLSHNDARQYVDDLTWDDLEMHKVFAQINACQTSIGEECLYAALREPEFSGSAFENREKLIALFESDQTLRLNLQMILSRMGKANFSGLCSFCYNAASKKIRKKYIYTMLSILPLLFIALIFFNTVAGVVGLVLSMITNGVVYYLINKRIALELPAIGYFSTLLWCAGKILKECVDIDNPILKDIGSGFSEFKKLGGKLSGITKMRMSELDAILEYGRIIFLTNIRSYNKIIAAIQDNAESFRTLYRSFGEIDAAISILSYRKSLPFYCIPGFWDQTSIETEDIYHPLLDNPVLNTAAISKNSLISGSNASGKSTFIKAIAINGILAQTINTCTARRFQAKPALIVTSMAVRDNITAGESYFISEIKSLKRIIDKIPEVYCVSVIDEILKGTNTIERIAASVAVLRQLNGLDSLCMVATHDIELTQLLADCYDNYHFAESITDKGICFDYKLKNGPSRTRNAIKLLGFLDFDERIVSDANELVRTYEETKQWGK